MHSPWGSLPEDIDLLKFLLEKIIKGNPSCSKLRFLASDYKREGGRYSSNISFLVTRLTVLSGTVRKPDSSIDRETQVKMLFLLSAEVSKKLLYRLRMDAYVEVDWRNRIIKYRSNNGNLKLEGKHLFPVKTTPSNEERDRIRDSIPKPPESTKRPAPEVPNHPAKRPRIDIPRSIVLWYPANYYYPLENHPESFRLLAHDAECQNSLQELPSSPEFHRSRLQKAKQGVGVPEASEARRTTTDEIRGTSGALEPPRRHTDNGSMDPIPKTPGSIKRAAPETPDSSKRNRTGGVKMENCSAGIPSREPPNSVIQQLRQPKLEAPEAPYLKIGCALRAPEPPGAPAPAPEPYEAHTTPEALNSRNGGASRALGVPEPPTLAPEPSRLQFGANDAYTYQIKFLSLIQSLVLTLDRPNLSLLQTRIYRKIRKSAPDEKIPNDEISLALELLVAKLTNHSVPILSGNVESISLKEFLCYLKAVILNSNLGGLENLLDKINARIREPALKDKSIPMVRVAGLLQNTLNNAGV